MVEMMENQLNTAPSTVIAMSGLTWYGNPVLSNPSVPSFRIETAQNAPICDLIFATPADVDQSQIVIFSMKTSLLAGEVKLSLLDENEMLLGSVMCAHGAEQAVELVSLLRPNAIRLRVSALCESGIEFALTYLHLSLAVKVAENILPSTDPVVFPNWDRVYHPAYLTGYERLRRQNFLSLTVPSPMVWHHGLQIMLYPHSAISAVLATSGFYEPHEMLVLKKLLHAGDCFIDAGANIGLYSLYAAQCVGAAGRVLAFEPSVREIQQLEKNISLNDLQQIKVLPCALNDKAGSAVLRVATENNAGQNTLGNFFGYADTHLDQQYEVKLSTLDMVIDQEKIDAIRLIKIDVEGAELQVLRGASKSIDRFKPALLIEIFPNALAGMGASVDAIDQFLRDKNYIFHIINPNTAAWDEVASLSAISKSTNILALPKEI